MTRDRDSNGDVVGFAIPAAAVLARERFKASKHAFSLVKWQQAWSL